MHYHHKSLTKEQQALRDLRRYSDIVVKPADKGGAVFVWPRDLYVQEANHQLSDNRYYDQRLDRDPTQDYQKIVKDTVNDMIATCALPPTAQLLVVTTPLLRNSTCYPRYTNQTTRGVQLSPLAVALQRTSQLISTR